MRLKLSAHAFTRFWDVHAWSGVVGGLVLYLMFLTGSITLFHEQLGIWEEPLRQQTAPGGLSLQRAFEQGLAAAGPTNGSLWFYPPANGVGAAKLGYEAAAAGTWTNDWIDPASGAVIAERERLSCIRCTFSGTRRRVTGCITRAGRFRCCCCSRSSPAC
jgi:uncharacterized iron-regulated membrane protein